MKFINKLINGQIVLTPKLLVIVFAVILGIGAISELWRGYHQEQVDKERIGLLKSQKQEYEDAVANFEIKFPEEGVPFHPPALNEWPIGKTGMRIKPVYHAKWTPTKGVWTLWRFSSDTSTFSDTESRVWHSHDYVLPKNGRIRFEHYYVRMNSLGGQQDFLWTPALLTNAEANFTGKLTRDISKRFHYMTPDRHMSAMDWINWISPYMHLANLGGSFSSDVVMVIDDKGVVRDVYAAREVMGEDYIVDKVDKQNYEMFMEEVLCRIDPVENGGSKNVASWDISPKNPQYNPYRPRRTADSDFCKEASWNMHRNKKYTRDKEPKTYPWFVGGMKIEGADGVPLTPENAKKYSRYLFK